MCKCTKCNSSVTGDLTGVTWQAGKNRVRFCHLILHWDQTLNISSCKKKANHTTNQHRSVWELSLCQCFPGLSFTSIWYLQNTWTLKNICEMLVRCQFYKFVGERHSTEIWWGQILYWAPNKYWVQTEPWHLSRPPNLWSLHFKREKYKYCSNISCCYFKSSSLSKTCLAKCNGKCSASRIFPPSNWTNR